LKLEDMESHTRNYQFMVQVLKSHTSDNELQIDLLEKNIRNKDNHLSFDEIQEKLSLRYERLSFVAETINDIDLTEKKALFMTQF
jgi:3-deoxy-D-manno-octulosonate 8-phosphate phosphatase KdsC-like HAD superfamily phosphatase